MTSTTSNAAALAEQYFAMWNETDADQRDEVIAAIWATDGAFVDPSFDATGHADLSKLVATAQQLFPGYRFSLTGEIDEHHNRLRWTWLLATGDEPAVAGGTDIVTLDADGKIREVVGFHDFAPAH